MHKKDMFAILDGENGGPAFCEKFLELAHFNDSPRLKQECEFFLGFLFLNLIHKKTQDMKEHPDRYREIFQRIIQTMEERLGSGDSLVYHCKMFMGKHIPGLYDDKALYQLALDAYRTIEIHESADPNNFFAYDGHCIDIVKKIGKRLGKATTPEYKEIVGKYDTLAKEALREYKEDHPSS